MLASQPGERSLEEVRLRRRLTLRDGRNVHHASTLETTPAATPMSKAPSGHADATRPASADPTGLPARLTAVEIANVRPHHAGSAPCWRAVNRATTITLCNRPIATMLAPRDASPGAMKTNISARAMDTPGTVSNSHSRPGRRMR